MTEAAIAFRWQGDGFTPANPYWGKRADKAFVIGAEYMLLEAHDRSHKSHAHYFASIKEAWRSLCDEQLERWPTAEHFRKHCLIARGFCKVETVVFSNNNNAGKAADLLRPVDEYAVIDVRDNVLMRFTAESQSYRSMGKERFQASKNAVLEEIATILGATPAEIADAARSAA